MEVMRHHEQRADSLRGMQVVWLQDWQHPVPLLPEPVRAADELVAVLRLALNVLWPCLRKPRRPRERRKPDGGSLKLRATRITDGQLQLSRICIYYTRAHAATPSGMLIFNCIIQASSVFDLLFCA